LTITPITFKAANEFVKSHHRHPKPVVGMKFAVAVEHDGQIVGVAITGRPVARKLDNGTTLEVNRCCTDGTPNACSALYGAAWRVAKSMGYQRLITYTLPHEGGASLRGAGWTLIGLRGGGNWNVPSRPREDTEELLAVEKHLWEIRREAA
jgi:hypothetical protein